MTTKELAKKNYERGLWTDEMLAALASKGKLSDEDFKEITAQAPNK